MLSRWLRRWSRALLRPFVRAFMAMRISANNATMIGLALAVIAGALVSQDYLTSAAIALLAAGLLDAIDGELARHTESASPYGAFLDSVTDHYGDFAVYLGVAWSGLKARDDLLVLLAVIAMFGSIVGSHIRSRAGMVGLDAKDVGIFTRAERIVVFVVGFATGYVTAALAVIAVAQNVSALQRLFYTMRRTRR